MFYLFILIGYSLSFILGVEKLKRIYLKNNALYFRDIFTFFSVFFSWYFSIFFILRYLFLKYKDRRIL